MKHICWIFSKYLVFQMKNLVFHRKSWISIEILDNSNKKFLNTTFKHLEFEIIGLLILKSLSEIRSIPKNV